MSGLSNVIKVDFKNHKTNYLDEFSIGWISALKERCEDPEFWNYHIRFMVYQTDKNFAVQFFEGVGGQYQERPRFFTSEKPKYKKDLDKLWQYIFNRLDYMNADQELIKEKIRKKIVEQKILV